MTEPKLIITFPDAAEVFLEDALRHIRDLKPGEILLTDKEPKILDITNAKALTKKQVEEWCRQFNIKIEDADDQ